MRPERTHLPGTYRTPDGPLSSDPCGLARLWRIVRELNPSGNVVNCGHTIDAVIHRLTGANPSAVSHNIGLGGSFEQIASRHGTRFTWNHSLDAIYHLIHSGGHGTIGLVAILWGTGSSHIVAIGNVDGVVGICEGQDWNPGSPPEVVADTRKAKARYNPTGSEVHGLAVVRWGSPQRFGWVPSHTNPVAAQPRSDRYGFPA